MKPKFIKPSLIILILLIIVTLAIFSIVQEPKPVLAQIQVPQPIDMQITKNEGALFLTKIGIDT